MEDERTERNMCSSSRMLGEIYGMGAVAVGDLEMVDRMAGRILVDFAIDVGSYQTVNKK